MTSPTKRQAEALEFIRSFTKAKGYGPSFSEIAAAMGVSSLSTVYKFVHGLELRGAITVRRDVVTGQIASRSITIVEPEDERLRKALRHALRCSRPVPCEGCAEGRSLLLEHERVTA